MEYPAPDSYVVPPRQTPSLKPTITTYPAQIPTITPPVEGSPVTLNVIPNTNTQAEILPSEEQKAIFREVAKGTSEVMLVDAKAGSGKTTTLLHCLKYIPKKATTVALLAYNRGTADLLKERSRVLQKQEALFHLLPFVDTFHAYGRDVWTRFINARPNQIDVTEQKTWHVMQAMLNKEQIRKYGNEIVDLVSKAKLHCIAPDHESIVRANDILPDRIENWRELVSLYGIKPQDRGTDVETLIKLSRQCLKNSIHWAGGFFPKGVSSRKRMDSVLQHLERALAKLNEMQAQNVDPWGLEQEEDDIERKRRETAELLLARRQFILDFDDMLYLPIIHGANFKTFDYIMVDEAQDMSAARAALVHRMRQRGSRLLLFGDNRQQIYQFAGATSDVFTILHGEATKRAEEKREQPCTRDLLNGPVTATELSLPEYLRQLRSAPDATKSSIDKPELEPLEKITNATTGSIDKPKLEPLEKISNVQVLPLSLCRRCPTSVISLAQEIVPEIQAHPKAKSGVIKNLGSKFDMSEFRNKEVMVVCRKVIPLLNFAYYLMANGIPVELPGRHIGRDLLALIQLAERDGGLRDSATLAELQGYLLQRRQVLKAEELATMMSGRFSVGGLAGFDDRLDSIMTLAKYRLRFTSTIADLKRFLVEQHRTAPPVLLATVHRARGLERPHVVVLNELLGAKGSRPLPRITTPDTIVEENLTYIAYTRAKESLSFIKWKPQGEFSEYQYVIDRDVCRITGEVVERRKRPWTEGIAIPKDEIPAGIEMEYEMRYRGAEYGERAMKWFANQWMMNREVSLAGM